MIRFSLFAICFLLFASTCRLAPAQQPGFAVIELFTTENCPICDQVEAALSQMKKGTAQQYPDALFVVYHTSSSESPGPYVKADYANRQNAYCQAFQKAEISHPQIIVNGTTNLGADLQTRRIEQAIQSSTRSAPGAHIELKARKTGFQDVTIRYEVTPELRGNLLQILLVQKEGDALGGPQPHVQIVRDFKSVRFRGEVTVGNETCRIPGGVDNSNLEIIAFSQNPISGQIVAVASCPIDG